MKMNSGFPRLYSTTNSFNAKLRIDLERIVLFICDICEVGDAFITLESNSVHDLQVKFGLQGLTDPRKIKGFKQLIKQKEVVIISSGSKKSDLKTINAVYTFNFFAGFPIKTAEGLLQATICILDKNVKELSSNQLKTIKAAIAQIESLLQLYFDNEKLRYIINENLNQTSEKFDFNENLTPELKINRLGRKAEDFLEKSKGKKYSQISELDLSNFADEFETRQMELRIQNEEIRASQKALEITALKYRELYDYASFGYLTLSKSGKITEGNSALAELIGKERSKLINDQFIFFVAEHSRLIYTAFLETIFNSENKQTCEIVIVNHKNARITILLTGAVSKNGQSCYLTAIDISGIKDSQGEILKRKDLVCNVIQHAGVGILAYGPKSEILESNIAAGEMLGLKPKKIIGKSSFDPFWNVIYPDGSVFKSEDFPIMQSIKYLKSINDVVMGVHRPLKNDLIWLLVDAVPIFDNNNELIYVICSFTDITKLRKLEEDLAQNKDRFYYASIATSIIIWDWNLLTQKVFVSNKYYLQFGFHFDDNIIEVEEFKKHIHEGDRNYVIKSIHDALTGKDHEWCAEYRYSNADGTYTDVKDKAIIIRDENGLAIRMIGAMQDISHENKLKNKLLQSEIQFKRIFEYSTIGIALVDKNGFWQEVNSTLCNVLGYSKEEFRKITVFEITHPDDLEEDAINKEKLDSGIFSSFNMEKRYRHKDKSFVWVHLYVSVVKNDKGEIINYIPQIIDITERKRVEQVNKMLVDKMNTIKSIELNEATGLYRLLADNTIDLVCLHHMNSKFTYVSPSVSGILGFSQKELLGRSPFDFVHPKDYSKLQQSILEMTINKKEVVVKLRLRNKEGTYIWCESTVKFVLENGVPVHFQTSTRDITQEREAKVAIKKAITKEQELNKLRINLVSTISHELRTPMSTILSNTDLIEMFLQSKKLENVSFIDERLKIIRGEIERIVSLMDSVLVLSKNDVQKTNFSAAKFDLKQFCLKVITESNFDQKNKRNVKTSFTGDSFPVLADVKLMEYILINLLKNAFKYSAGSEDVLLRLFIKRDIIFVEIIDSGIGIPEKEQENIFNIFFRASNTSGIEGTGLGLYIVKIFTETNLGSIKLESKLGKGTKVLLQFPLAK